MWIDLGGNAGQPGGIVLAKDPVASYLDPPRVTFLHSFVATSELGPEPFLLFIESLHSGDKAPIVVSGDVRREIPFVDNSFNPHCQSLSLFSL